MFNHTIIELLTEQRLRERRAELEREAMASEFAAESGAGIRGALGSTLVRWGLRLDPAASERIHPLKPAPATTEGKR